LSIADFKKPGPGARVFYVFCCKELFPWVKVHIIRSALDGLSSCSTKEYAMRSLKKLAFSMMILVSPAAALAANAWYLVEAQCSSDDSRDAKVFKFTGIVEAATPRSSQAEDSARFGFLRMVEKQIAATYCANPDITPQNASASYAGDSKAEAEKIWNGYVKRDMARKKPWLRHVRLDVDAMNEKVKVQEDKVAAEEEKKRKAVSDKREQEDQARQKLAAERKQKHDAWCEAEGTAKGYCSCPRPPGAKTCTK
jgi:hypothetical protein